MNETPVLHAAYSVMACDVTTPTTIPTAPPVSVTSRLSARNCATISRAVAPTTRRRPISPRPFQHGRQHGVHDPDATDQQRQYRHAADDDVEGALRTNALVQQIPRHDDVEVGRAGVCAGQRAFYRAGHGHRVVSVRKPNPDIVDALPRPDRGTTGSTPATEPIDAVEVPRRGGPSGPTAGRRAARTPTTSHQPPSIRTSLPTGSR